MRKKFNNFKILFGIFAASGTCLSGFFVYKKIYPHIKKAISSTTSFSDLKFNSEMFKDIDVSQLSETMKNIMENEKILNLPKTFPVNQFSNIDSNIAPQTDIEIPEVAQQAKDIAQNNNLTINDQQEAPQHMPKAKPQLSVEDDQDYQEVENFDENEFADNLEIDNSSDVDDWEETIKKIFSMVEEHIPEENKKKLQEIKTPSNFLAKDAKSTIN